MALSKVQQIEHAVRSLSPHEVEELYLWIESNHPRPFDEKVAGDLNAGRLDAVLQRALDQEQHGDVRAL